MTILWANNASTTIAGTITPASTTVTLAAGTGAEFPSPTGGNLFKATFYDQATKTINEIVHCTARSGDVCTIVRAQEGTTAGTWNAGDIFANLITAGTLAAFVQTGTTPAANTTIVYTGDDTSTTPNLIICNTNPVPASLVLGMQFNIRVKNTNTGPVNVQLNGGSSLASTRQDGAQHVAGDLTATEEMIFVYNGVNLTSMVMDVATKPPQNVFYVRPDGNDNNSGLSNTPTAAFATIYGAIHAIRARYISQTQITINVADGTYVGGFSIPGGYIESWNIVGDTANPLNCVIDATSTSPPAGASPGVACTVATAGQATVSGFKFKSYYNNIGCGDGSKLNVSNCRFTNPAVGASSEVIVAAAGGTIYMSGANSFEGGSSINAFALAEKGAIQFGYSTVYGVQNFSLNILNPVTCTIAFAWADQTGVITIFPAEMSFSGSTSTGCDWRSTNAGGFATNGALAGVFPGTVAGYSTAPGWP